MPSLTSQIRAKQKDKRVVEENKTLVEEPEFDTPIQFDRVLFITDIKLSMVKDKVHFQGITEYSDSFINRSSEDLFKLDIKHIWINIANKKAKKWLEANLKNNRCYSSILTYIGSSKNKFLTDLKPYVDIVCPLKQLNKFSSLNLKDLLNQVDNLIQIHSPASKVAKVLSYLGCGNKNLKSSNSKNG